MSEEDEKEASAEATPEETELYREEVEDTPEEAEWNPFEETDDDFKPNRLKVVKADDGLPSQAFDGAREEDIPPLSVETLVCMEDTSKFVRRDGFGRVKEEISPKDVVRMPNGLWYEINQAAEILDRVEPLRPRCIHYVRQMGQGSLNPTMKEHYRLCSARRTTEGTFMSVRNQALWACSMRNPRDEKSEQKLDDFDEMKIEQGREREYHSIFGKVENG